MIVQSVWIGNQLSVMNQLCIDSYLYHGHEFHLYSYNEIKGLPKGTTLKNGNDIMPFDSRFPDCASFADAFRYKMLLVNGGWYVDMDTVCLRTFDFSDKYIFAAEEDVQTGKFRVNNNVIKVPPNSAIIKHLVEQCDSVDLSCLAWGDLGPTALTRTITNFNMKAFVKDSSFFNPFPSWAAYQFTTDVTPGYSIKDSYTVHLWNELWKREQYDPNKAYSSNCLYEKLKRKYWRNGDSFWNVTSEE